MAGQDEDNGRTWVDGVASIVDSVTNLYNAVSTKSPTVADAVLLILALTPAYAFYTRQQRRQEKETDARVKKANAARKRAAKESTRGITP